MGQAIDGNEVRKRMLWGVVAACAISNGQAQDEALLAPFREIERFARDLKSVADMRNECLRLDPSMPCVPEISANKYVLNIRFMAQNAEDNRPRTADWDVRFELTFCNL